MLAQVVLIEQLLLHCAAVRAELQRMEIHEGDLLQNDRIVHGVFGIGSPGERAVAVDQHGGDSLGGLARERLDDDLAGLLLIFARDLLRRHWTGAGDLTIEVVALRRAHGDDADARLRKARCPAGVRVDDAADPGEGTVQLHMRRRVARGLPFALDDLAVQIHDDHVPDRHAVIADAGRLDDDQTAGAVDPGDIAPGKGDETVLRQQEISLQHLTLQFLQHGALLTSASTQGRSGTGRAPETPPWYPHRCERTRCP